MILCLWPVFIPILLRFFKSHNSLEHFIIECLPRIPPNQRIGHQIIYSEDSYENEPKPVVFYSNCPVGRSRCTNHEMCQEYRKYDSELRFKRLRYEFAKVCHVYVQVPSRHFLCMIDLLTVFQKCGLNVEPHRYNTEHLLCILCQSTEEFLEDPDYFSAHASEVESSNEEDVLRNYVPIWGGMSAVAKLF